MATVKLHELEAAALCNALEVSDGNRTHAACLLGISGELCSESLSEMLTLVNVGVSRSISRELTASSHRYIDDNKDVSLKRNSNLVVRIPRGRVITLDVRNEMTVRHWSFCTYRDRARGSLIRCLQSDDMDRHSCHH